MQFSAMNAPSTGSTNDVKYKDEEMNTGNIKDKYVLYGAGKVGRDFLEYLGVDRVLCFIDSNPQKRGERIKGIEVYPLDDEIIKKCGDAQFVVTVLNERIRNEITRVLKGRGIDFLYFEELKYKLTKEKIASRIDYIEKYRKTIEWITNNTIPNKGIVNNTQTPLPYPEVTGYYIPSLLRWGYRDMAVQYAKWLCKIQKEDGSWYDTEDKNPYVFDSGQILKGLIAIRELLPDVDRHIRKGCDWIISNVEANGRLCSPRENDFGDGSVFHEIIHLYCLSPLVDAGRIFGEDRYIDSANKILKYYLNNHYDKIMNFSLLSHFYAYVMEALVDMDEADLAREAMGKIKDQCLKENGEVSAYNNCDWVCSTGMFQLATVWYRLGEVETGNKVFNYAIRLQNESGGWYGSYLSQYNKNEENTYFPYAEISWTNKYFLDALYYKNKAEFDIQAPKFKNTYDSHDGRYQLISNVVSKSVTEKGNIKILDVGCGKGGYVKNIAKDNNCADCYAIDISDKVISYIEDEHIHKTIGTLTMIPFDDNYFDLTYACESLEHAIDIKSSIREMSRVTKTGGFIIIIDRNKDLYGYYEIDEWEQWFGKDDLMSIMSDYCSKVEYRLIQDCEGGEDNLFGAWIGVIK